jgi:mannosyltransferase
VTTATTTHPAAARLRTPVVVAACVAVALATCLPGLGRQPLSWDEAVTANAASRPLPDLWALVRHTDAPLGLYYLLMHGWTGLLAGVDVRTTETWLRVPSALAAVAAVGLTAYLGSRIVAPVAGLVAGLLLAVHPLLVFYAHDARPYTLVALAALGSVAVLRVVLDRPSLPWLALYAASCVLLVYLHLLAALVLLAQAVVISRYARRRRRFLPVALVVALAAAPLLWLASHQSEEIGWVPAPTAAGLASFVGRVGSLALLPAAVLALARWWSARGRPPARDMVLLGAWALVPPLGLALASFAQPLLVPRYALVAVPALALLVGVLAHAGAGRLAAVTVAVAVLASVGVVVVQQSRAYKYENFRAAADAVADNARAGDALLFLPSSYRVGYYEYPRPDHGDSSLALATDVALRAPAHWRDDSVIGGQEYPPAALAELVDTHERVFLVGSLLDTAERQRRAPGEVAKEQILRAGYQQAWAVTYGGVSVSLLIRPVPGATEPARPTS